MAQSLLERHTVLFRSTRAYWVSILSPFIYLFFVIVYIAVQHKLPAQQNHALLTLAVFSLVHLVQQFWLARSFIQLNTNSIDTLLESKLYPILQPAKATGLTSLYQNRSAARDDVLKTIDSAEHRLWLLGVAFSEDLKMENIAEKIGQKLDGGFEAHGIKKIDEKNVKILLLNVYRSPSVFRSFFETAPTDVQRIIEFHTSGYGGADPLLDTRVFTDFENAYQALRNARLPRSAIRYYAHFPNCWMVIADDVAFYQPYTLGKSDRTSNDPTNLRLGSHLPVFTFQKHPVSNPFEILEDHFVKMWLTAGWDLLHMGALKADDTRVVSRIFGDPERMRWLTSVSKMLNSGKTGFAKDRRADPRQDCRVNCTVSISFRKQTVQAKVIDYSLNGLRVKLADGGIKGGDRVSIRFAGLPNEEAPALVVKQDLRDIHHGLDCEYEVRWPESESNIIGLGRPPFKTEPQPA